MPYCEGKSKAQVWFKYGSDWEIFKTDAPVDWICDTVTQPTPGVAYHVYIQELDYGWSALAGYCWIPPVNRIFYIGTYLAPFGGIEEVPTYGTANLRCPSRIEPYVEANFIYGSGQRVQINQRYARTQRIYKVDSLTRTDGGNDPVVSKFKILNINNNILYERTEPTCPTVEVKCGDTCPPQTVCECDCGTEVCCYDATGTPIYSYPK